MATRRGNGPGHGGPRKGEGAGNWASGPAKGAGGPPLRAAGDDYSDHVRALAKDPAHAEAKAALRELVFTTWVQVATSSENDSARVAAADKIADRIDGKATQDITTKGERIGYVIPAPLEAGDAEEWAAQHKPR